MLNDRDHDVIRARGIAQFHDIQLVAPVSGEPFLEDGVLSYYDGRMLAICGHALRCGRPPTPQKIRKLVRGWLGSAEVDSVMYLGPAPPRLRDMRMRDYRIVNLHTRDMTGAELFIPVAAGLRSRVFRRSAKRRFESRSCSGSCLSAAHLKIVERFYRSRTLTAYLAEAAITLPIAVATPSTVRIEAWEKGVLRGFVVCHQPFDSILMGIFLAHDDSRGVSDFLYGRLLEHAHATGATHVNVGPSPTLGHYLFKKKWGGVPLVPPYYACVWQRSGVRDRAYRSWLPRILRLR